MRWFLILALSFACPRAASADDCDTVRATFQALVMAYHAGHPATGAVHAAARRTDAVVYAVTVARPARLDWSRLDGGAHLPLGFDDDPSADKFLAEVCSLTGGRVFVADTTRDLASRFRAIVEEFKNRYLLTYAPSGVPASGWHPLQVRVKRGGVKVNARRGYER